MLYNRFWFDNDLYAITIGGGEMNNPGRYLTLLPPINGATAATGTPYFTEIPVSPPACGMPHSISSTCPNSGLPGGRKLGSAIRMSPTSRVPAVVTPPTGNNGYPAEYACNDGAPAGTTLTSTSCANDGGVWYPDLRHAPGDAVGRRSGQVLMERACRRAATVSDVLNSQQRGAECRSDTIGNPGPPDSRTPIDVPLSTKDYGR